MYNGGMKAKHLSAALLLPCAAVAAEIREYSRDAAFIEDYRRGAIAMCRKMTDRVNEAIEWDDKWRENEFWKILGEEYVELAFRYARGERSCARDDRPGSCRRAHRRATR